MCAITKFTTELKGNTALQFSTVHEDIGMHLTLLYPWKGTMTCRYEPSYADACLHYAS